jgi:hypothetical protein
MAKSLATLKRGGVLKEDIYVFVVAEEEEKYKTACPGYTVVVGVLGLVNQRNFIHAYFPLDTHILMMDDDIEQVCIPLTQDDKNIKQQITDLPEVIGRMILRMGIENVTICGVYPIDNAMFALGNKEVTTNFRFLVGCFYLIKNTKEALLVDYDTDNLEDKIRAIRYFEREKKTLRFNWVCVKQKYFGKGGLYHDDRGKKHEEDSKKLVSLYPQYLRLQKTKHGMDAKFKKLRQSPGVEKS